MDFICKVIRNFHCIIIVFLYSNSIYKRLPLSVPDYMDFYMSHLSAYLPKDADPIEKSSFPVPKRRKKRPISCPAAENGALVLFLHFTSYGRPSAFSAH